MTLQEKMKNEALGRLVQLRVHPSVIQDFQNDILNLSENGGMLYHLNDSQKKFIKNFEAENNALVYHVIHDFTGVGEMLTLLYIPNEPNEWAEDLEALMIGYPIAYVINLDNEICSEFGAVGIEPRAGGLVRFA